MDLAAVLVPCDPPRRRHHRFDSEEVARDSLNAVITGLLFLGRMLRSEVSALSCADVDDTTDGNGDPGAGREDGRRRPSRLSTLGPPSDRRCQPRPDR